MTFLVASLLFSTFLFNRAISIELQRKRIKEVNFLGLVFPRAIYNNMGLYRIAQVKARGQKDLIRPAYSSRYRNCALNNRGVLHAYL